MKRLFIISTILLTTTVFGQQLPQYSQWMSNKYAFNPAFAGGNNYWEAVSNNRYQWLGITDAPRTFTLSAQGPLKNENMALGGYLYTDVVGPTRRIGAQISYTYHARLSETIRLAFGLGIGFNQWLLDADKITTYHPGDFYFSNGLLRSFNPDAKFGMYLHHADWYLGASIGQLFRNRVEFLSNQSLTSESFMEDHLYFMGGYKFRIGEDWMIAPDVLMKMGWPAPVKFDFNLTGYFREMVWLGAGFRTADAWTLMGGFMYKKMVSIGYSYDITHTSLKTYNTGTHEISLSVIFGGQKKDGDTSPSLE